MAPRAALQKLADEVCAACETWTLESVMSFRTPDCKNYQRPTSLSRDVLDNDQYRAWAEPAMKMIGQPKINVDHTALDTENNKIIMHATGVHKTEQGNMENEYVVILTTTEDGTKAKEVMEFVDSLRNAPFFEGRQK